MKEDKQLSIEYARQLDKADELARYQKEFYKEANKIYFDGNSLGLLSKRAEQSLLQLLETWKQYGIDGWTSGEHPWFHLSEKLGEMCAPLVGAKAEEVIITGSTTTNLHQLVSTFFNPKAGRTKILADSLTFPTDIYALKSQLELQGLNPNEHLIQVSSRDGRTLLEDDIIMEMTSEVALIVLPSVLYRSGQILDMERLTKEAHKRNILIGFDLCHSIGAIPHALNEWDVDFAVWCNYKHLNGGPGSVAGLYVNKRHFGTKPGLLGWFGSEKDKQFDMDYTITPAQHAGAFQMGTPFVLSAAPLLGSLRMFNEVGIEKIRAKSLQLTEYMMELIDAELTEYGFVIANPRNPQARGGHIYLEHEEAVRICKSLKEFNVIPDFRAPNGLRLAPVALYNTFEEVWKTIQILKLIMKEEHYKKFEKKREVVA